MPLAHRGSPQLPHRRASGPAQDVPHATAWAGPLTTRRRLVLALRKTGCRPAISALQWELGLEHALSSPRMFTECAEVFNDYAQHVGDGSTRNLWTGQCWSLRDRPQHRDGQSFHCYLN